MKPEILALEPIYARAAGIVNEQALSEARERIAMPFTTEGMYRGCVGGDGKMSVAVYR